MTVAGTFFAENGTIRPADRFKIPSGSFIQVYEVLRVINGKILFRKEHYERFSSSIRLAGLQYSLSPDSFFSQLYELIKVNTASLGNIRIDLTLENGKTDLLFYFIPHHYPSPDDYRMGVKADLLYAMRENPQAKVVQQRLRDRTNKMIREKHLYEVLLVDHGGYITEGSRSNVFFIKDGCLCTPPVSCMLPGITRMKVLECMSREGLKCVEKTIPEQEISVYDAAFLTGTSLNVLPLSQIGKISFHVNDPVLRKIQSAFDRFIDGYLEQQ